MHILSNRCTSKVVTIHTAVCRLLVCCLLSIAGIELTPFSRSTGEVQPGVPKVGHRYLLSDVIGRTVDVCGSWPSRTVRNTRKQTLIMSSLSGHFTFSIPPVLRGGYQGGTSEDDGAALKKKAKKLVKKLQGYEAVSKNILRLIDFYENRCSTNTAFQLLDPAVGLAACGTLSDIESLRELEKSVEKDINAKRKKEIDSESFALTSAEMLEMLPSVVASYKDGSSRFQIEHYARVLSEATRNYALAALQFRGAEEGKLQFLTKQLREVRKDKGSRGEKDVALSQSSDPQIDYSGIPCILNAMVRFISRVYPEQPMLCKDGMDSLFSFCNSLKPGSLRENVSVTGTWFEGLKRALFEIIKHSVNSNRIDDIESASHSLVSMALARSTSDTVLETVQCLLELSETHPDLLLNFPPAMRTFIRGIEQNEARFCIFPSEQNLLKSHMLPRELPKEGIRGLVVVNGTAYVFCGVSRESADDHSKTKAGIFSVQLNSIEQHAETLHFKETRDYGNSASLFHADGNKLVIRAPKDRMVYFVSMKTMEEERALKFDQFCDEDVVWVQHNDAIGVIFRNEGGQVCFDHIDTQNTQVRITLRGSAVHLSVPVNAQESRVLCTGRPSWNIEDQKLEDQQLYSWSPAFQIKDPVPFKNVSGTGGNHDHLAVMMSLDTIDMTVTADILMLASEQGEVFYLGNFCERLQYASAPLLFKPTIGIKVLKCSASMTHALFLDKSGIVYCLNEAAKLTKVSGTGDMEDSCVVKSIFAGVDEKCAAVSSSGDLFMWGEDSGNGELGWGALFVDQTSKVLRSKQLKKLSPQKIQMIFQNPAKVEQNASIEKVVERLGISHESGAEESKVCVDDSARSAETGGEVEPSQHDACEIFGFATDIIIYKTYAVFLGSRGCVAISGDYNARHREPSEDVEVVGATTFSLVPSPSKNSAFAKIIRIENDVMCLTRDNRLMTVLDGLVLRSNEITTVDRDSNLPIFECIAPGTGSNLYATCTKHYLWELRYIQSDQVWQVGPVLEPVHGDRAAFTGIRTSSDGKIACFIPEQSPIALNSWRTLPGTKDCMVVIDVANDPLTSKLRHSNVYDLSTGTRIGRISSIKESDKLFSPFSFDPVRKRLYCLSAEKNIDEFFQLGYEDPSSISPQDFILRHEKGNSSYLSVCTSLLAIADSSLDNFSCFNGEKDIFLEGVDRIQTKEIPKAYDSHRFGKVSSGWSCSEGSKDYIDFTSSENIEVLGVFVYRDRGSSECCGHIKIFGEDKETYIDEEYSFECDDKFSLFLFEKPFVAKPDHKYTISEEKDGYFFYGSSGKNVSTVDLGNDEEVKIQYSSSSDDGSSNGTDEDSGQILGIRFRKCGKWGVSIDKNPALAETATLKSISDITFELGPGVDDKVESESQAKRETLDGPLVVMPPSKSRRFFLTYMAKDIKLSSGKWYYEFYLPTNVHGNPQIGWADADFPGGDGRENGTGDDKHSWAFDGPRKSKWNGRKSRYGEKWNRGDLLGCAIDLDNGIIGFTKNGEYLGDAFTDISFSEYVYPSITLNSANPMYIHVFFGGEVGCRTQPPLEGYQFISNIFAATKSDGAPAYSPLDVRLEKNSIQVLEHILATTKGSIRHSKKNCTSDKLFILLSSLRHLSRNIHILRETVSKDPEVAERLLHHMFDCIFIFHDKFAGRRFFNRIKQELSSLSQSLLPTFFPSTTWMARLVCSQGNRLTSFIKREEFSISDSREFLPGHCQLLKDSIAALCTAARSTNMEDDSSIGTYVRKAGHVGIIDEDVRELTFNDQFMLEYLMKLYSDLILFVGKYHTLMGGVLGELMDLLEMMIAFVSFTHESNFLKLSLIVKSSQEVLHAEAESKTEAQNSPIFTVKRFEEESGSWNFSREMVDAIAFSVEKSVMLRGLGLYGPNRDRESHFEGKIFVCEGPEVDQDSVLVEEEYDYDCEVANEIVDCVFKSPIQLVANETYTVWTVCGDAATGARGSNDDVEDNEVRVSGSDGTGFTFRRAENINNDNGTGISYGQIPVILYNEPPKSKAPPAVSIAQSAVLEEDISNVFERGVQHKVVFEIYVKHAISLLQQLSNVVSRTLDVKLSKHLFVTMGQGLMRSITHFCFQFEMFLTAFDSEFCYTLVEEFLPLLDHFSVKLPELRSILPTSQQNSARNEAFMKTVESDHPYKAGRVSWVVSFPAHCAWMTVQFDEKCSTLSRFDMVQIMVNKKPAARACFGKRGDVDCQWPIIPLLIPGNCVEIIFTTVTSEDNLQQGDEEKNLHDKFGFKCTIYGFSLDLAFLKQSELAVCRMRAIAATKIAYGRPLVREELEYGDLLRYNMYLGTVASELKVLPNTKLIFLDHFLKHIPLTEGGKLAAWLEHQETIANDDLQDEEIVEPRKLFTERNSARNVHKEIMRRAFITVLCLDDSIGDAMEGARNIENSIFDTDRKHPAEVVQLTNMKPIWLKIVRDFKEKGLFERESIDQDKVEPRDHGLKIFQEGDNYLPSCKITPSKGLSVGDETGMLMGPCTSKVGHIHCGKGVELLKERGDVYFEASLVEFGGNPKGTISLGFAPAAKPKFKADKHLHQYMGKGMFIVSFRYDSTKGKRNWKVAYIISDDSGRRKKELALEESAIEEGLGLIGCGWSCRDGGRFLVTINGLEVVNVGSESFISSFPDKCLVKPVLSLSEGMQVYVNLGSETFQDIDWESYRKDLIKSYSDFEQKPKPDDSSSKIIETQVLSPSRILSNLRELLPQQMQISMLGTRQNIPSLVRSSSTGNAAVDQVGSLHGESFTTANIPTDTDHTLHPPMLKRSQTENDVEEVEDGVTLTSSGNDVSLKAETVDIVVKYALKNDFNASALLMAQDANRSRIVSIRHGFLTLCSMLEQAPSVDMKIEILSSCKPALSSLKFRGLTLERKVKTKLMNCFLYEMQTPLKSFEAILLVIKALECWKEVCIDEHDHFFLQNSELFPTLRSLLVATECSMLESQCDTISCLATNTVSCAQYKITGSSGDDKLKNLVDGDTSTFWESTFEDREKDRWIRVKCDDNTDLSTVALFIDNTDKQYTIESIELYIEVGGNKFVPVDEKDSKVILPASFKGWTQLCATTATSSIEILFRANRSSDIRVNNLSLVDNSETIVTGTADLLRYVEGQALEVFKTLTHDVYSTQFSSGNSIEGKNVHGVSLSLRERLAHMVFADYRRTNSMLMAEGLQLRVFKVLKEGLESEIDRVDALNGEDTLMFEFISMLSSMSASAKGLEMLATGEMILSVISLIGQNSARVQRMSVSLLRRILPALAPECVSQTTEEKWDGCCEVLSGILTSAVQVDVMLPYGGNIQEAIAQKDRDAIRLLLHDQASLETRKANVASSRGNFAIAILMMVIASNYKVALKFRGAKGVPTGNLSMQSTRTLFDLPLEMAKCFVSTEIIGVIHNLADETKWKEEIRKTCVNILINFIGDIDRFLQGWNGEEFIQFPSLWMAIGTLAVVGPLLDKLGIEGTSLLAHVDKSVKDEHFCSNCEDNETFARFECLDCESDSFLCDICDKILHKKLSKRSHKRKRLGVSEAPQISYSDGVTQIRTAWMALVVHSGDRESSKCVFDVRVTRDSIEGSSVCRYCGEPNESDCCDSSECQLRKSSSCTVLLPCSHKCCGVMNEKHCLPCLYGCTKGIPEAKDYCHICFSEELQCGPCVQLKCGHIFHAHCVGKILESRWNSPHISFSYLQCPLCRQQIEHSYFSPQLELASKLYDEVRKRALMRAEYEKLTDSKELSEEGSRFFGDLEGYALSIYAYYECHLCKQPYYGGLQRCEAGDGGGIGRREDMICPGCQPGAAEQNCAKHGSSFLEYKCRFCCSTAVFFCFGTTHFCDSCHDIPGEMQEREANGKLPPCPAGPRGKQLECDKCPLGVRHPPTGVEYALGCGICRNAKMSF